MVYFLNHLKTFSSRSSSRYRNPWIRLTVQSYRAIKGSLDSASVPAAFLSPEFIVKEIKAAPGPDCELEATGIWYSREMPSLETLYIMAKEWDMELLSRRFFLYYSTKMRISKLVLKTYQICKKNPIVVKFHFLKIVSKCICKHRNQMAQMMTDNTLFNWHQSLSKSISTAIGGQWL